MGASIGRAAITAAASSSGRVQPHHGHQHIHKRGQHGPPVVPERAAQELQQQAQEKSGAQPRQPAECKGPARSVLHDERGPAARRQCPAAIATQVQPSAHSQSDVVGHGCTRFATQSAPACALSKGGSSKSGERGRQWRRAAASPGTAAGALRTCSALAESLSARGLTLPPTELPLASQAHCCLLISRPRAIWLFRPVISDSRQSPGATERGLRPAWGVLC